MRPGIPDGNVDGEDWLGCLELELMLMVFGPRNDNRFFSEKILYM